MKSLFEKKKYKIKKLTKKTYKPFYDIYNEGLRLILKLKDELISEFERGEDEEFNKACLVLLCRSIQHLESIVTLTEAGLYGDATALIRNIMSDMDMLYYLHFNPQLINIFLKESAKDYQTNKNFNKYFNESAIDRFLSNKGLISIKESFQKLSKGNHASSWGCQFYGTRGEENKYNLKYEPGFETYKTLYIFPMIIPAHYDFINIILQHKKDANLNLDKTIWKETIEATIKLNSKITKFIHTFNKILNNYDCILKNKK
jgi:hypothetical protein